MKLFKTKPDPDVSLGRLSDRISKKPTVTHPNLVDLTGPERKPDFLCIGSEKAGTTWLWHWMKKHPKIGVPASKELRFFSSGDSWDSGHFSALTRFLENPNEVPRGPRFKNELAEQIRLYFGGLPAYLRIFGNMSESVVGEISPQYCALPSSKVHWLHSTLPDAKIIYMLRDPADRLLSGARMVLKQDGLEINDANILRYAADPMQRQLSNAAKHIDSFETLYGPEKIKVVFFEDIADRPSETFDGICEFLGVGAMNFSSFEMSTKINKGVPREIPEKAVLAVRNSLSSIYNELEKRYPEQVENWRSGLV